MELIEKNIEELKEAAYNPRIQLEPGMPEYEKLKSSIETFGKEIGTRLSSKNFCKISA